MSFHLEGPWLSTTGKKKGKQKFRSADEARKARELAEMWRQKQSEWSKMAPKFSGKKIDPRAKVEKDLPKYSIPVGRETTKIPSLPFTAGPCTRPEQKVYTGSAIKGIGTMHKSNAVPIFSDEEAIEISKMRR
jgi:hypothetical protein